MPAESPYRIEQYQLLRAEALCAEMMENGIPFDEIIIRMAGSFRKSYRNDVERVRAPKESGGALVIEINRDGLYDRLPEGLFHQTRGGGNTNNLRAMTGEYRRYRDEERLARKFFQPIEQELFRYAVLTEAEERQLQFGMLKGKLDKEFYRFWNIDAQLPEGPASVLVLIMPWIRQIKGDLQLTARALSMMLGLPVTGTTHIEGEQDVPAEGFLLGDDAVVLGVDTVCGHHFEEPYEQWIFSIEGVALQDMALYTSGKPYGLFLERFESLFIPLEVEVQYEYHCDGQEEDAAEPVLGYGFYL
ncbi:hypothetical protein [Taibaiella helva]|uniref:hypothetical protein n=1 Tax=Taibaiella helva TaxID=2301235 RepID=UPI00130039B4|nr:hypothetical protein [Taibaiella helva]